tara:strand:- start:920 stop:1291 length:372 start_codon:yes stop_codon:yes gene_type:complete
MIHLNTEYEFHRTSAGKTISVTATIGVYDEDDAIPTKKRWARKSASEQESFDIPDFSSLTPVETKEIVYTIPEKWQTTETPVDRTKNADQQYGEFDEFFWEIRAEIEKDSMYETLREKYMPTI